MCTLSIMKGLWFGEFMILDMAEVCNILLPCQTSLVSSSFHGDSRERKDSGIRSVFNLRLLLSK